MNAEDDDAQLVAYIDRELDQPDREALEARLAREPSLRERLAQLERGERPFAAAFKVLLDAAPLERLQASLAAIESREEPETSVQPARGLRLGGLAAAAAILLFVGGLVIGRYGFPAPEKSQSEDWRQAVAEYASLYTSDTFAALPRRARTTSPRSAPSSASTCPLPASNWRAFNSRAPCYSLATARHSVSSPISTQRADRCSSASSMIPSRTPQWP